MTQVNMFEAKSSLSKLVEAVESGAEPEVIIARNGKPAARLVPVEPKRKIIRGVAKGKYVFPENFDEEFDALDEEIAELFNNSDTFPE